MTDTHEDPQSALDDEDEARTAWLLRLSVDQVSRYDATTIYDWMAARSEQRCARLRAACQVLRETSEVRQRAYARLLASLGAEASRPA